MKPTQKQVEYADYLAKRMCEELPAEYTKQAYSDFISKWKPAVKAEDDAIDSISRQDAIDAIYGIEGCIDWKARVGIRCALMMLPTAERTGKWVDDNGRPYKGKPNNSCWCSECGEWLVASDEYSVSTKFCPNCGARMINGGK